MEKSMTSSKKGQTVINNMNKTQQDKVFYI